MDETDYVPYEMNADEREAFDAMLDERECPKLSLGIDSTLGNWRDLTASVFGEDSAAVTFWDDKISSHDKGRDEWVLADEQQTLYAVGQIHIKGLDT
jgi:hypothetical protein